jgi:hypothetical protein
MYEIRVFDLDAGRLMQEEGVVKAAVRKLHIKARVTMMADNLAIARMGLMEHVPAIEVDGRIVASGKPILLKETMALFEHIFDAKI